MTEEMKNEACTEELKDQAEACEAEAEEACEACEEEPSETEDSSAEAEAATEAPEEQEKDDEKYIRLLAEFQNYKKRVAKEKADIHAFANEKIVTDLLPILDNFERALEVDYSQDPEKYAKGIEQIFDLMKTALTKAGLEEVEALGAEFDPTKHNAVSTMASEEHESGNVSQVFQKGYSLNKKVIRPAMVVVAE